MQYPDNPTPLRAPTKPKGPTIGVHFTPPINQWLQGLRVGVFTATAKWFSKTELVHGLLQAWSESSITAEDILPFVPPEPKPTGDHGGAS
jgi:hypothetical protein